MATKEEKDKNFNWSHGEVQGFSNEDLVCHDCENQTSQLDECKAYKKKPGKVMYGGECDKYAKQR